MPEWKDVINAERIKKVEMVVAKPIAKKKKILLLNKVVVPVMLELQSGDSISEILQ
jgi:hypothetical protein